MLQEMPVETRADSGLAAPPTRLQASQASWLMRILSNSHSQPTPLTDADEAVDAATADAPLLEANCHVITQKTIMQCQKVRTPDDLTQWDKPVNKRHCTDMERIQLAEGDSEDDDEQVMNSAIKGRCPVCEAVKRVIEEALYREVVVSSVSFPRYVHNSLYSRNLKKILRRPISPRKSALSRPS